MTDDADDATESTGDHGRSKGHDVTPCGRFRGYSGNTHVWCSTGALCDQCRKLANRRHSLSSDDADLGFVIKDEDKSAGQTP